MLSAEAFLDHKKVASFSKQAAELGFGIARVGSFLSLVLRQVFLEVARFDSGCHRRVTLEYYLFSRRGAF